ncbi:hypothetical protein [Pontibacter sp. G13]|uniref:hypothetical protein n=1 Tax=Pontibacter sp. G13 TaxID=3074898 RepID=UPI00288C43B0|nr:hypothetical protein [Pontibacter sp. G13]WNJ20485.1 hypothetical protein RJD25_08385 [Pontibacter sp. G13]
MYQKLVLYWNIIRYKLFKTYPDMESSKKSHKKLPFAVASEPAKKMLSSPNISKQLVEAIRNSKSKDADKAKRNSFTISQSDYDRLQLDE